MGCHKMLCIAKQSRASSAWEWTLDTCYGGMEQSGSKKRELEEEPIIDDKNEDDDNCDQESNGDDVYAYDIVDGYKQDT